MKKILYIIGILTLINTVLIIVLLTNKPEVTPSFGGTTHLGGLELAETLSVTGISTFTGQSTFNDGIIQGGGVLALGETASTSITAAQFCDNSLITLNPTGSGDDVGASISLPTSALLIADCLPTVGDSKVVIFDNVASATERNFEFTTYNAAAGDYRLFLNGGTALVSNDLELQVVRAIHITGTSVSYQVIESTGN